MARFLRRSSGIPSRVARSVAALGAGLLCAAAGAAQADAPASLEQRLQAIEALNQRSPWRESAALIDQLGAQRLELSDSQRYRLELVEARNFALAGDYTRSLAVTESLLARPAAPELRIRALTLAVNVTTNVSDYPRAYVWIEEGLALLDQIDTPQPRLLGMASYVYLRAGEERLALDYAEQALEDSRSGTLRDQCVALSDYAIALDETGRPAQAEGYSREQIAICKQAGDPVFVADGHKGVGRALVAQKLYAQAIPWLTEARKLFEEAGFRTGSVETGIHLANALLHSDGSIVRARELIDEALPVFEAQQAYTDIETARLLLGTILERSGRPAEALAQLRLAQAAHRFLDEDARERRLGYLQMKFDSQAKERRISALQQERAVQAATIDAHSRLDALQWLGIACLALLTALLVAVLRRAAGERRRYRELSERDGLTGLYNHQATLRLGSELIGRSHRERRPFTAIVADLDGFKQINDRFGHAAGDAVLRDLGQLLREVFPQRAVVGRSGGEEFTMFVDASSEQAHYLIEDLRRRIEPLTVDGARIDYSLSYGVCEADSAAASLEALLRRADMALYRAKRTGRNRVVDAASMLAEERTESSLVVVGCGIQAVRHLSSRSLAEIQEAERVLALADGAAHTWLAELRPDLVDLRTHARGDRRQSLRDIEEAVIAEVLAGRRVCVVFDGHPAMSADLPHALVRRAREAGFSARMEPGISAEACLYADLGIDPGRTGVLSLEAAQLLDEDRLLDTRSLLLVWLPPQTEARCEPPALRLLMERLLLDYPGEHEVALYQSARLATERFRAERLALRNLAQHHDAEFSAVVVPPCPAHPADLTAKLLQSAGIRSG